MNRFFSLSILLGCVLLAFSCSRQPVPAVKKTVRTPVYAGKVERVYPRYNYVLIALAGNVYEPGTVLISQSRSSGKDRRVANLIVTAERMGRKRIPADIRSGAVEAGDLVFLYQNLAAPESSGTTPDQQPDRPAPETEETGKKAEPPLVPEGSVTKDGLLPLPGQHVVPAAPAADPADQERISREREKILRELDNVPGKLNDPWREFMSEKAPKK